MSEMRINPNTGIPNLTLQGPNLSYFISCNSFFSSILYCHGHRHGGISLYGVNFSVKNYKTVILWYWFVRVLVYVLRLRQSEKCGPKNFFLLVRTKVILTGTRNEVRMSK